MIGSEVVSPKYEPFAVYLDALPPYTLFLLYLKLPPC